MPTLKHEKWFQQLKGHLRTMKIDLENPEDCRRLISSTEEFNADLPTPIFSPERPFEDTDEVREMLFQMSVNGGLIAYGADEDSPRQLHTDKAENMTLHPRPEEINPVAPNMWQRFMHLFGFYNDVYEKFEQDTARRELCVSRKRTMNEASAKAGVERKAHQKWENDHREEREMERKLSVHERTLDKVDILLGPKLTGEEYEGKAARIKNELTSLGTFSEDNFHPSDYTMKGITKLSAREVGLCAFAATVEHKVIDEFACPPGKKDLRSEEVRQASYAGDWYNTIEGIFTDHMRNNLNRCAYGLGTAGKIAQSAALKYEKGDPAELGRLLGAGLKRNVENVIGAESLDKSASAFCMLTGSLLKLLEDHPDLMKEARKNGVTPEVVQSARAAAKMGELIQKAAAAEKKLQEEEKHPLSEEERLDCATDIAIKNLLARDHQRRRHDLRTSKELSAQREEAMMKLSELSTKKMKDTERSAEMLKYTSIMAQLDMNLGFGLGIPVPGATSLQKGLMQEGGTENARQGLRQCLKEQKTMSLNGKELVSHLYEMTEQDLAPKSSPVVTTTTEKPVVVQRTTEAQSGPQPVALTGP